MSKFDELLETIKTDNPDLAEQMSTAYLRDLESRDEKIVGLESTINEQRGKISEYAQENYDLMRAQPPAGSDDDKPEPIAAKQVSLDDVEAYWRNKKL